MPNISGGLELRDVTEAFRRYRDFARVLWNVGMRGHPDSAVEFGELDPALFRALFTSYISRDSAREVGPNLATIYPQIRVRLLPGSASAHLIQLDGEWRAAKAHLGSSTFAYGGLFDFDWDGNAYRDFQYVRCSIDGDASGELLTKGAIILLEARNVEVLADSTLRPYLEWS